MKNEKKKYVFAETQIISLERTDVIVTSNVSGDDMDSDDWDEINKK